MSNKEKGEKENRLHRFDDGLPHPSTKLLHTELAPKTLPPEGELSLDKASPFLSVLPPKPPETAPRPPQKSYPDYPKPQRPTVSYGTPEFAALEAELLEIAPPKPPSITPSNILAVVQNNPSSSPPSPLPLPTPAALKAKSSSSETFPLSPPKPAPISYTPIPDVLGTPSESLLSEEDLGEVADPSETLSALLDEVFSEGLPDFEAMFHSQGNPPTPLPPPLSPAPIQAPPWDPIATLAAKESLAYPPLDIDNTPSAPPPPSSFVIPSARITPMPEPAASLFETEPTESLGSLLTTTLTEIAQEEAVSQEEFPFTPEETLKETLQTLSALHPPEPPPIDEKTAELPQPPPPETDTETETFDAEALRKMLASAPETLTPSFVLTEKETVPPASQPIFRLSSPPCFVDPENKPAPPVAPSSHPLEKTHEALPAPLWRLLGAFHVDAFLLCSATLAMLWVAKTTTGAASWLNNAANWKILGPTSFALLALLAFAYTAFFAIAWNGASPGRQLFGLQLLNKEGLTISFPRACLRAFLSLFSFAFVLSGFWWAIADARLQTFHDKCVGTFVVRVQPKKQPPKP
ncbi:MAG: RDD family protein [Cystobacterineae bacterium]|nr:RDD family protein [Cystobacterineae bacterium]